MAQASREYCGPVLKTKILEFRNYSRNPYQNQQDVKSLQQRRTQDISKFENAYRISLKSIETTTPYLSKRLMEETANECSVMKEMKRKEVENDMNKRNELIEDKLGKFLDREHFEEEKKLKRTVFLRQNDPDLKVYANSMRSKAVGLIQRSQMISKQINEKKEVEQSRDQELRWMNEYLKNEYQRQCDERIDNLKKRDTFAKEVKKQLEEKQIHHCEDFEAERKRCDTIVAKELAEMQAEHNEALRKKYLLHDALKKDMAGRCNVQYEERDRSIEMDHMKALEMKVLDARRDADANRTHEKVETCIQKQLKAGNYLKSLEDEIANRLDKRAFKASNELAIEKNNLASATQVDDIFAEPFKKTILQAAIREDLNRINEYRTNQMQREKEEDQLTSKIYLEEAVAVKARQDHMSEMRRQAGLESGECLRNQILEKKKESEREKHLELEAVRRQQEEVKQLEREIAAEKQKLGNEYSIWESNLILPDQKPGKQICQNRLDQTDLISKTCIVPWITETQAKFGTWQPVKPYHPLVMKKGF